MQFNTDVINTEAEFKAACVADGDRFLAMLRYMQKDLNERIMNTELTVERNAIYYEFNNLNKFIKTIENIRLDTAPQLNI